MILHSLQKQPDLKLKTWPEQLLGYLPKTFVLSATCDQEKKNCNDAQGTKAGSVQRRHDIHHNVI
jgi:hypothetical protein